MLKDKVTSIKNENSTKNDDKLKKLDKLKNTLEQIKTKLANVIKEIDDLPYPDKPTLKKGDEVNAKDKFKGKLDNLIDAKEIEKVLPIDWKDKVKKYNEIFKLLNGFLDAGRINNLIKRFIQTDNSKTGNYTEAELIWQIYETTRLNKLKNNKDVENLGNKKLNHNKDVMWLMENIKKLKEAFDKEIKKPKPSKVSVCIDKTKIV
ncbi:hypothetical protein NW062_01985 [Mycoplasmopsis cynos]|nr:hypothetical protein NW062_01985 [Mycoplasmopsis cynos]